MKDTFDLTKFLKENKSLENLNPTFKSLNKNKHIKDKIKEMILAELGNPDDEYDTVDHGGDELEEAKKDKKVEDVETTDVETTDTTEEDAPEEDAPEEDAPEEDAPKEDAPDEESPTAGGGLEDIAADMEGTEGDLMDHLMKALKVAKGMNNEKLETQIGNTLKFFVSEYIGGEEQ
jgi:hypothetical protein